MKPGGLLGDLIRTGQNSNKQRNSKGETLNRTGIPRCARRDRRKERRVAEGPQELQKVLG